MLLIHIFTVLSEFYIFTSAGNSISLTCILKHDPCYGHFDYYNSFKTLPAKSWATHLTCIYKAVNRLNNADSRVPGWHDFGVSGCQSMSRDVRGRRLVVIV